MFTCTDLPTWASSFFFATGWFCGSVVTGGALIWFRYRHRLVKTADGFVVETDGDGRIKAIVSGPCRRDV